MPDLTFAEIYDEFIDAKPGKVPEKSGGNVDYYTCALLSPKRQAPSVVECEDLIEALGMTFAEGCAFKAIWRSCAARTLGLKKEGQDEHGVYDADKVAYYGARMGAVRRRLAGQGGN